MNRHPWMVSLGFVGTFSLALPAYAQAPTNRVDAEALASAAAALVEKGDFAQACAKYEASARLDPSARRFMKFADCQERAGILAGAWISFGDAQDRAEARGDKALEAAARNNARRLEAKLARIEIVVPQGNEIEDCKYGVTAFSWSTPFAAFLSPSIRARTRFRDGARPSPLVDDDWPQRRQSHRVRRHPSSRRGAFRHGIERADVAPFGPL